MFGFFALFFSKKSLSKSTIYLIGTSPLLVQFLNSTIPWEPKIRTIREPPVYAEEFLCALLKKIILNVFIFF